MRFNLKRSKITGMRREEQGMASIVVVSVLIIIMTLISIGFARIMNRSAIDSANKQFSASATYAAESGVNDVAAYLKQYALANPGSNFLPKSTKCNGAGSLIGSSASPGPFYGDSNLSNDTTRSTQYTCLLLNPNPNSLVYTQVQNLKSQVVKVNTSASTGAIEKLMISWQPSNSQITGYPSSSSNFSDETTWNTATSACKDSSSVNSPCLPLLRLSIYPVSSSEALTSAQAQSKTVFLYPQSPTGNVLVKSYLDPAFKDGSIVPVACTQTVGATDFNPASTAPYKCNIIISSLSSAISPGSTDSVYLRITPIYNQADVEIQANDKYGNYLSFVNDQAVVDVTAQTAGVAKRLQARIDTSSLVNGAVGVDTNISSSSNDIPEQALRQAVALCKREIQTTTGIGFSNYVNFDDPDGVCHDLNGTSTTTNPVPTLTFSITGNNGTDNGRTVDSEANNPDIPQNPVQLGTVFVGSSPSSSSGTATINWTTTDATSCTAGGGWTGEKNGDMKFTGNPPTNGAGYQNNTFTVSGVTSYTMQCSRPYAPSATPVKTVTIWPYPRITGLSASPNPVYAGNNYTISWSSTNTVRCSLSNGPWNSPSPSSSATSGSDTENWPYNDNSSTRTYTVTCYDPIGRSDSSYITVSPNGNTCSGDGCSSSNGESVAPPPCSASVPTRVDNGNGTGYMQWSGSCPTVPAGASYFQLYNCTNVDCSSIGNGGWVGQGGTVSFNTPGTYCIDLRAGLDPWGWRADSGSQCITINWPPISAWVSAGGLYGGYPGCDSAGSGHFWCENINYGGSDPAGQWLSCTLYVNGTYEGTAEGYNPSNSKVVGWPTLASAGGTATVTCYDVAHNRTSSPTSTGL